METHFKNDLVIQLPDITKITFQKIDKDYFKVIIINFLIVFFFLLTTLIVLHQFVFSEKVKDNITYIYTIFIAFFVLILSYLILSFPKRKYALREKDITYKCGVFTKNMTTIPFSRIQHVEIDEKPISRLFGLSSISVYTAGDSSDDLEIKGIKNKVALQIKEFISTKIDE